MKTIIRLQLLISYAFVVFCSGWTKAQYKRRHFLHTVVSSSLLTVAYLPSQARNLPEPTDRSRTQAATIETLIPILQLKQTAARLLRLIEEDATSPSIEALTKSIPTEEKSFKSIFDAYSDPVSYKQKFVDQNAFLVYYTKGFDGPGRPSMESDLPVKQTLQYGSRNDAWVAFHEFLAEYNYQKNNTNDVNVEYLMLPLKEMIKALDQYLSQAPSEEIAIALQTMNNSNT